jgi:hypothetical protein
MRGHCSAESLRWPDSGGSTSTGKTTIDLKKKIFLHEKTIAAWVRAFCCYGIKGAPRHKPQAVPPTLTPTHKAARVPLIDAGPVTARFRGACWRSPMVQPLM